MPAELISTREWDHADVQTFLGLGLGRDEISFYEFNSDELSAERVAYIDTEDIVSCLDYSPLTPSLVAYGLVNGSLTVQNGFKNRVRFSLNPESRTKCMSTSFNTNGFLATCWEKQKSLNPVLIFDIESSNSNPVVSLSSSELVLCSQFVHDSPSNLLLGCSRSLKEYDIRSNELVHSFPSSRITSLHINPLDSHLVASYGDKGILSVWDRRMVSETKEPLIQLPRIFHDEAEAKSFCFRFSFREANSFSVLYNGSTIRRYQLAKTTGGYTAEQSDSEDEVLRDYSLFTEKVFDVETDYDRVVSFDYVNSSNLEFVCLRQSGSLFKMKVQRPLASISFSPDNQFRMMELPQNLIETAGDNHRNIKQSQLLSGETAYKETPLDDALSYVEDLSLQTDDSDASDPNEFSDAQESEASDYDRIDLAQLLNNDITSLMQHRARLGYSMNSVHNTKILHDERSKSSFSGSLLLAWKWIDHQLNFKDHSNFFLKSPELDLRFAGISCIWQGLTDQCWTKRARNGMNLEEKDKILENAVKHALKNMKSDVYISIEDNMLARRRLCLRLCGWGFGLQELELELEKLESQGKYEKAAGWAVFHNNVERAVECLARSRKNSHRLMSTAIAAYQMYKDVPTNNVWREQCRKLASEISSPYLRAIFAYISDGSWLDVIDDASLPLPERIGIAMRFLSQNEVSTFLSTLKSRAIANGDLEGIIVTGLTPQVVDLLQAYIDRSGDVQTAALLVSYGHPKYIDDPVPEYWLQEYRQLLNSWQYFAQRARMDIAKRKHAGEAQAANSTNQAFLRCNTCHKVISEISTPQRLIRQQSRFLNKCPHCKNQFPPCGICSLPLGHNTEDNTDLLRWPIFCLNCNHGYHALHAEEWFEKYTVCPVPQCKCLCGSSYKNT